MDKAGQKTFIVPVFIPHKGCPHRCIFCNQTTITGTVNPSLTPDYLHRTITEFLKFNHNSDRVQISFYGGTFLGLDAKTIKMCLSEASDYIERKEVHSIRFSTRPDSVTKETLALIKAFPVETIELGTQSMNNRVLQQAERGHTAEDTVKAVGLLKTHGYETGLQLMPGLPFDTEETILDTTAEVIRLQPDFVRIYPTIAFKGSGLEKMVERGDYSPLELETAVTIVKKMYLLFSKHYIPVIRMGLQSSVDFDSGNEIVDGPYHPAFGHLVFSSLFLDMAVLAHSKNTTRSKTLVIHVSRNDISKMRGLKNNNISVLLKALNLEAVKVKADESLEPNNIRVNDVSVDITSLYKTV